MKPTLNINESFICKIWEGGSKYFSDLATSEGDDVEVISFGRRNNDAGPDYLNSKIKIGSKILTGDVEIHRDFSNWSEHHHNKDRKYNSVILQVVMWDSKERTAPKLRLKRNLPTVILSHFLKSSIHDIWQDIINKPEGSLYLPCINLNNIADDTLITDWLRELSLQRLNIKTERIKERLDELAKHSGLNLRNEQLWEQLLYEFTFEALGFSKNKEQMMELAAIVSLSEIQRLNAGNSLQLLQAVLYGAGGFLFDLRYKDEYISQIKAYWKQIEPGIKAKRQELSSWNFFRLRPQNFPTIRIAYGSQLIRKILNESLYNNIIQQFKLQKFAVNKLYKSIYNLLKPETDEYWESHYNFGRPSKSKNKLLGRQRYSDILVNVIIPLVNLYSEIYDDELVKRNIIELYNGLEVRPDNSIVKLMNSQLIKKRKIPINSPAAEQGIIHLYNFYCIRERCGECLIGKQVFSDKGYEYKIIFY